MKITEFVLKEGYKLDDASFSKCMELWRKVSKFDHLMGINEPYQIQNKVFLFFQAYCNMYFSASSGLNFYENV